MKLCHRNALHTQPKHLNKVAGLQEGEVVETGSHPDLIAKGGLFASRASLRYWLCVAVRVASAPLLSRLCWLQVACTLKCGAGKLRHLPLTR